MLLDILFWGPILVVARLVAVPIARPELREACGAAARFGLGLGVLLFFVGYVGPMLWSPDANQGPLLGIFVTGPAGFVLGAVAGFLRGVRGRVDTVRRGDSAEL